MGGACTYVTSLSTSKSYIFVSESSSLSLWYFFLQNKTNICPKCMRRLISLSVNYISGERYISYKITQ